MGRYHYKAFGLNIASDFELPELLESHEQCDVEILRGNVEEVEGKPIKNRIIMADSSQIIYELENVAACKITGGSKALIMPSPSLSNSSLRLLILTSVIGCILIQRKMMPIHGSCVSIGDHCIIISGQSGSGKSTLTGAFIGKGYSFLSDDISVIGFDDSEELVVQPGYPYRKLHNDSAAYHSLNTETLERIEYEDEKFLIPVHDRYVDQPRKVIALVEIVPMDVISVSIEKIMGISKLNVLMENLYRGRLASYFKSMPFYFEKMGFIASKLDVYRVIRPLKGFTCEEQIDLLQKELNIKPAARC